MTCMHTTLALAIASVAPALLLGAPCEAADTPSITWHDAKSLTVEGRGWTDTQQPFDRLPAKAEAVVPPIVWHLARNSAGIVVRFTTDSPEIRVKWKLTSANLAMNHMPATGVSGVDLYVKYRGNWRWLGVGRPNAEENESTLVTGITAEKREYALYLPLYNGVSSVEIGIPESAKIEPVPSHRLKMKPVVLYGTSILQGGCACRPGMAYPSIIGRKLDIETVNLGFSGAGQGEHVVSDLLAELDPQAYVIDCLPNMNAGMIDERIRYMLAAIKAKHPRTPVILVEEASFQYAFIHQTDAAVAKNKVLAKLYKDLARDWNGRLFYVKGNTLMGKDGEPTVDGVHPNDIGFQRMADALAPVIKRVIETTMRDK